MFNTFKPTAIGHVHVCTITQLQLVRFLNVTLHLLQSNTYSNIDLNIDIFVPT